MITLNIENPVMRENLFMNDPVQSHLIEVATKLSAVATKLEENCKATNDLIGEVRQQRVEHAQQVKDLDAKLEKKLEKKADSERVKKLEDHLTWLVRLVMSAVLLAIIGLVVVVAKPSAGQLAEPPAVSQTR